MKPSMKVALVLLGLNVFGSVPAALAESPAATQAVPVDEKINNCNRGLEQILPGDYYACEARYYFQNGHNQHGASELEEAAYWASKDAQFALGLMYFNGDMQGIPANRPLALAWLALAAERNDFDHQRSYAIARAKSSEQDIQASDALLKKMQSTYGDKVAGLRAMRRFNHEIAPLEDAANTGGIIYLRGYSPFPEDANTVVAQLHAEADKAFQGLIGTVTVGPLQVR
ncbi:hypothetical protein HDE76_004004 [Rhodanobacter sp. ANJX3]|uniref:SEL1-like repeat protein n=1 Tax=Rhodanobacter sp. ANJX3 TaxID=2723083 RepID=UPI001618D334|nr:hypothetical protein [Rhodanobacter sp. ANJX3]